ncbi:DUF368 domain-containing protein [Haloarchaeobius sp. TZWWS8]|uniref:DUF368 domain-containing protein n=1 Tax=Haloarchaeobius sp. TZWWS8 TaxID=3446121 RepID=UPI003EBDAEC4
MREALSVYLKGFLMGAADTVPGVSGGTIALITGIYERLIGAITAVDAGLVRELFSGRDGFVTVLEEVDAPFLVALGLGIVTAVVTLSRVLHDALQNYPALMAAFFFGLIAASALVLYGEVDITTPGRMAVAILGIVLAAGITMVPASTLGHTYPVIFASGMIAICAMILPGVSGSFFLYVLQQYEFMTGTLKRFTNGLLSFVSGGDLQPVLDSVGVVVVFCLGAVVGLLSMSRAVKWAFEHYREATLTFLVSLMVGGLRLPMTTITEEGALSSTESMAAVAVIALVGAVLVIGVDFVTDDLEYA